MKVLLYIAAYLAVGFVFAVIGLRVSSKDRGYSVDHFLDLDDDEQTFVIVSFLAWPIVIIVFIVALIFHLITKIANLGLDDDKE